MTIPNVPPAPTDATAVQSGDSILVSWTDNAGPFALGYQISRSVNGGPYSIYADLPETSDSPPTTQTFTDTNVPLGHTYTYEIVAENIAGFSAAAFATVSMLGQATLTLDNARQPGSYRFSGRSGPAQRPARGGHLHADRPRRDHFCDRCGSGIRHRGRHLLRDHPGRRCVGHDPGHLR